MEKKKFILIQPGEDFGQVNYIEKEFILKRLSVVDFSIKNKTITTKREFRSIISNIKKIMKSDTIGTNAFIKNKYNTIGEYEENYPNRIISGNNILVAIDEPLDDIYGNTHIFKSLKKQAKNQKKDYVDEICNLTKANCEIFNLNNINRSNYITLMKKFNSYMLSQNTKKEDYKKYENILLTLKEIDHPKLTFTNR